MPIYESAVDEFDDVMNVNAKGILVCTRAVTKAMMVQESRLVETRNGKRDLGRGSIVNIGSANSYAALPGKVAYVTSKHAVMGTTKTAGKSLKQAEQRHLIRNLYSSRLRCPGYPSQCRLPNLGPHFDA